MLKIFLEQALLQLCDVNSPSGQNVTVKTDTSNVFYPVVSTKINKAVNEYQATEKTCIIWFKQY